MYFAIGIFVDRDFMMFVKKNVHAVAKVPKAILVLSTSSEIYRHKVGKKIIATIPTSISFFRHSYVS